MSNRFVLGDKVKLRGGRIGEILGTSETTTGRLFNVYDETSKQFVGFFDAKDMEYCPPPSEYNVANKSSTAIEEELAALRKTVDELRKEHDELKKLVKERLKK